MFKASQDIRRKMKSIRHGKQGLRFSKKRFELDITNQQLKIFNRFSLGGLEQRNKFNIKGDQKVMKVEQLQSMGVLSENRKVYVKISWNMCF